MEKGCEHYTFLCILNTNQIPFNARKPNTIAYFTSIESRINLLLLLCGKKLVGNLFHFQKSVLTILFIENCGLYTCLRQSVTVDTVLTALKYT